MGDLQQSSVVVVRRSGSGLLVLGPVGQVASVLSVRQLANVLDAEIGSRTMSGMEKVKAVNERWISDTRVDKVERLRSRPEHTFGQHRQQSEEWRTRAAATNQTEPRLT